MVYGKKFASPAQHAITYLSKHNSKESNEIEIITSIGVPVQKQRLFFNGIGMNRRNTLSAEGVWQGESGLKMSKFFVRFCGAPLDLSNLPKNNEICDLPSKSERFPRFLPADILCQLQESGEFGQKDFSEGKARVKWQTAGSFVIWSICTLTSMQVIQRGTGHTQI